VNLFYHKIDLIIIAKHYGLLLLHPLLKITIEKVTGRVQMIGGDHGIEETMHEHADM
jgi:hypothetical protein